MVLAAVAELSDRDSAPSNRQIATSAGIADQGQISRLLARLEGLGLLQNTDAEAQGLSNAWQLTTRGEEILRASTAKNSHPGARVGKR